MTEQDARDFLAALGAEIAHWRRVRKMTREQLAALVGVSASTLGRIERADEATSVPTPDVWRIAHHLGLNFSDLVRRAEEANELSEAGSSFALAANEGQEEQEAGAPNDEAP